MTSLFILLALIGLMVVATFALFIPVFVGLLVLLAKLDGDESLILPFWRSIWRSSQEGARAVAKRTFPGDLTQAIIAKSQDLNRDEAMGVRSLSRVEGVVSIYHAQFLRLSREAEKIRLKFSPRKGSVISRLLTQFIGPPSDECGDILDHVVNYSFAHGKNYATERPIFYVTPRTTQVEEELESSLGRLSVDVESVRKHDMASIQPALRDFVMINEFQSMTFQREPEPYMNAVTDVASPEKERLTARYLQFMDYGERDSTVDFCAWIRNAHSQFKREERIYERQGRIGRRLAYVFFSMRLVVLELARMPAYKDSDEYAARVARVAEQYTKVYPAMQAYLQDERDNARSQLLLSLQAFLHEVHVLSGNYRVVTPKERVHRQYRLWREASVENMAKTLFWMNVRDQFIGAFDEAAKRSDGDGPVYKLINADVSYPETETPESHGSLCADDYSQSGGALHERRLWNVTRLLNAGVEDIARFVAASAMVQPPGDYDRVVVIGNSGVVPGSIMSFAFNKRMSLCFLEPLDFFPLPLELETLAIVDESLQTGYSASVAMENLQRMNFRLARNSVLVVLKYAGSQMRAKPRDRFEVIMHEEMRNVAKEAKCIVDYGYDESEDGGQAHCIVDRSAAVPEGALHESLDRLKSIAGSPETVIRDVGNFLADTCSSETHFKPELLFSYPNRIMYIAKRWYDQLKTSSDALSVIASGPLELPLLTYMAMVARFSDSDERARAMQFLAYNTDSASVIGQMQGHQIRGTSAFILCNFINSGASLREVAEHLRAKGVIVKGCLCLFSKVPQEELRNLVEVPLVEKYVDS
jgi:orotate phosphoribosyltransferase